MFFDTPVYLVFLALITIVYWRLGWRSQNKFLLVASYIFYGWWDWRFVSLILIFDAGRFLLCQGDRSIDECRAPQAVAGRSRSV